MPGALFEYILDKVEELEKYALEESVSGEKAQDDSPAELWGDLASFLMGRLHGISNEVAAELTDHLRKKGDLLDGWFADAYTRDMLERIPKMVARTKGLASIVAVTTPSKATEALIRGATQTYVFGFWDASMALCRAALEQALWEVMKEKVKNKPESLNALSKEAVWCGTLDKLTGELAMLVVRAANRVLHEKGSTESEARGVLWGLRSVTQRLYGNKKQPATNPTYSGFRRAGGRALPRGRRP